MFMNMDKIIKSYLPMTETAYYILLSLRKPRHGYGIMKHIEKITNGRLILGSGTVYGTLTKMKRDGVITIIADEKRKTVYEITEAGKTLLSMELKRLKELYQNGLKYEEDFQ